MINISNLNKDEFNKAYDNYLANKDYDNLINYLKTIKFNDVRQQIEMNNAIDDLTLEGARYKSLMRQATPEQASDISFLYSVRNKSRIVEPIELFEYDRKKAILDTFNANNPKAYSESIYNQVMNNHGRNNTALEAASLWNSLGGKDNNQIKIKLEGQEHTSYAFGVKNTFFDWLSPDDSFNNTAYEQLLNNLGLSNDTRAIEKLNNLGIDVQYNNDDGTTDLIISKDRYHDHLTTLLDALDKTSTANGYYRWSIVSETDDDTRKIYDGSPLTYEQMSITENENTFRKIIDIYHRAQDTENSLLGYDEDGVRDIQTDIVYTTVAGAFDADLKRQLDRGEITNELYNNKYKSYVKGIESKLRNLQYYDYNIWANDSDEKDQTLIPVKDTDEKIALGELINYALTHESNTDKSNSIITKSFGNMDGKYGMLLSINAYTDKDVPDDYKVKKRKQIFIEGFYDSEAQRAFENDTSSKAQTQLGEINRYRYPYNVSIDEGGQEFIEVEHGPNADGKDENTGFYIKTTVDANGNMHTERLGENPIESKEIAKREIERKIIAKDAINRAIYRMTDPDGNFIDDPYLVEKVDDVCMSAVQSLYPEWFNLMQSDAKQGLSITRYLDFFNRETARLREYILSQIGYNSNSR